MTLSRWGALIAIVVPALALANGGHSSWTSAKTAGAVLPGDGGVLSALQLVKDEEVECVSEDLSITLRDSGASVRVEYVLLNHGPTKQIDYAFPFAIGEQETVVDGARKKQAFGKPRGYALAVDGAKVAAMEQPGLPIPAEIPVPTIDDNEGIPDFGSWTAPREGHGELVRGRVVVENRYRFTYFVSPLELPSGKPVKLSVTYTTPYLVYTKRTEVGEAQSPPSVSYLLSTGNGWRGGKIGRLKVVVRGPGSALPRYGIEGLPFSRAGDSATFEQRDVEPSVDMNLFIVRSEFQNIELSKGPGEPADGLSAAGSWRSPLPSEAPPALMLKVPNPSRTRNYRLEQANPGALQRFRLGLAPKAGAAQPARIRVELGFEEGGRDAFHATFRETTSAQLKAQGGLRYVYFDAPYAPSNVRLTFLEVHPGKDGSRRLQLTRAVLEHDTTNYTAFVPTPR